jgi:hypothetical protein
MKIDVQFLQKRSDGRYRYRRLVPKELQPVVGKRNILISLGRDEGKALKLYGKANAQAEKLLSEAAAMLALPQRPIEEMTPLEYFRLGQQEIRAVGLAGDDEETTLHRDIVADQMASHFPVDENGHPIGMGPNTSAILNALRYGRNQKQPDPTLEDVRRLYLKERIAPDNEAKKLELERVFRLMREALGSNRTLSSLRRADAKEVRDHMLDGRKPASVGGSFWSMRTIARSMTTRPICTTSRLTSFAADQPGTASAARVTPCSTGPLRTRWVRRVSTMGPIVTASPTTSTGRPRKSST